MDFTPTDPLLAYPTAQNLQAESQEYMRQIAELQQRRSSINMQAQVSATPLWDEIDKIEDGLTDGQRQALMQNTEYAESLQYVSKLVQDEVLRIVRPRIEATSTGSEALKKHLSIAKRLRRDIAQAEEQKNALVNEYMSEYSNMTWNDFVLMKQGKSKKGGSK